MSIKPKKRGHARAILVNGKETVRRCENPRCGAKLPRQNKKYCDRVCRQAHDDILKQERRPKEVLCAFCGKVIDTMRAAPSYWETFERYFCDGICRDGYQRQSGQYQDMSRKGNEKAAEYRDMHSRVIGYEERAKAVSENNRERPPKAKHFVRQGRVWGYDVKFYPHEDGKGYRVSVPELDEELGILYAKTVKEGLKMVRERIVELRIEESKGS